MNFKKRWQLESFLQNNVSGFQKPKQSLEQYETPPDLSSTVIWNAFLNDDIFGKLILDLGSVMGAARVLCLEIDENAIDTALENLEKTDCEKIVDIIQCDVRSFEFNTKGVFDTVILNPPFGTKGNKGLDVKFLETAFKFEPSVIYSFHKSSTRRFISKKFRKLKYKSEIVSEMVFSLRNSYAHHRKKSKDIRVDLFRFTKEL